MQHEDGQENALVAWSDPQVQELERLVGAAESALLDVEVDVTTLRVELDNFALVHHRRLGPLYERLDELDALVAEARAAATGDAEDIRQALKARAAVAPMPDLDELLDGFAGGDGEEGVRPPLLPEVDRVRPAEETRRLFRELARAAHPDLVQDEEDKRRRGEFIARVNAAYARGDVEALRTLTAEWAADAHATRGAAATGRERVEWLTGRLDWLRARLDELAAVRSQLLEGPMGQLLALAPDDPDALLDSLAESLLERVEERQHELDVFLGGADTP